MKPLLTVGLTIALLVAAASAASGTVLQLHVDPVHPHADQPVTFTVKGEQPDPCYQQLISEELTGVEGRVITLWFALIASGRPCPAMITEYQVEFDFPDGFPAGSYEIRVHERMVLDPIKYVDNIHQFDFVIDRTATGVPNEASGWGAVKALYGQSVD